VEQHIVACVQNAFPETCIKANSPLANCLIKKIYGCLTTSKDGTSNLISSFSVFDVAKKYQTGRWWGDLYLLCIFIPKIIKVMALFYKVILPIRMVEVFMPHAVYSVIELAL